MTKPIILGAGPEFMAHEGLADEPAPWEDGLRADTGRGSFEWWYFDAHLQDGSTAVVTCATKPLLQRNDPLTPMLALTITRPDGRKLSQVKLLPPDQFSAARERCDVRIGPSRVVHLPGSAWRYDLHAEAADLAAQLTFTGSVPAWRPGAGKNYYDATLSRYFAWFPAIPFGTVQGTLTYDGQPHAVTGTGYHDHNWGNIGLDAVMSHWVWGRAHVGDYTLIYVEMVSNRAYGGVKLPVFMLAKGERILIGDGRPLTLQTGDVARHRDGRRYPQRLDWRWQSDAGTVSLTLRDPQVIEAASLLGFLPAWKRRLARLVANPYYFRFNADLELEVNLGTPETVHGPALYEIMLLR
jgi:hypothetical protein